MSEREQIRRHLAYDFTEPIRDPLWSHIYLTKGLMKVVSKSQFQQLGGIRQLGPTYMVYPGATHTRLNHSLGVFSLARKMIQALTSFDAADVLTETGVRSFLCAALLHDLGHFPYAHSLKELPIATHESLTAKIILETSLKDTIEKDAGADPRLTAQIVDTDLEADTGGEVGMYRNILSGVLDPDKLDYLTRDAYFCGVPYGIQDVDFIISKIGYHPVSGMVVDSQGLHAVENVLFSKYLMYRTIYWHKTVRIATAMIKKAIYAEMSRGELSPNDLYGLDDGRFFIRFTSPDFAHAGLIADVHNRRLHKLVAEIPFDEGRKSHSVLTDLAVRAKTEAEVGLELGLGENGIIIDIPEPISFEVDLSIQFENRLLPFVDSGTVFTGEVVSGFVKSLRKIRVFVDPKSSENDLIPPAVHELLN